MKVGDPGPGSGGSGGPALVLLALLAAAGCASGGGGSAGGGLGSPAADGGSPPPEPAPLRPGDAVRVTLSLEPDRSGQFTIDEEGRVGLPFLGDRRATGLPPDSLRRSLIADYRRQLRNQTIDVRLLRRVRVLGQVAEPGLYHVDATMSLADVVARAGGTTSEGELDDVRVLRRGTEVNTSVRTEAGAFERLRSGDQVYVPRRSWFARHSGVLLSGAISMAGFLIGVAVF